MFREIDIQDFKRYTAISFEETIIKTTARSRGREKERKPKNVGIEVRNSNKSLLSTAAHDRQAGRRD